MAGFELGLAEVAQHRGVRLERVRLLEGDARRFVVAGIGRGDALLKALARHLDLLVGRIGGAGQSPEKEERDAKEAMKSAVAHLEMVVLHVPPRG